MPARVAGIDGCRAGWVCAALEPDGAVAAQVFADFASAMAALADW